MAEQQPSASLQGSTWPEVNESSSSLATQLRARGAASIRKTWHTNFAASVLRRMTAHCRSTQSDIGSQRFRIVLLIDARALDRFHPLPPSVQHLVRGLLMSRRLWLSVRGYGTGTNSESGHFKVGLPSELSCWRLLVGRLLPQPLGTRRGL